MKKSIKQLIILVFICSSILPTSCSNNNTEVETSDATDYFAASKAANEAANEEMNAKASEAANETQSVTEEIVESKDKSDAMVDAVIEIGELNKVKVLSDMVELLIPESFSIMSEDMAKLKYPTENRPSLIYTNESASVNIAFRIIDKKTASSDLPIILDVFKKSFDNQYSSLQWFKSAIEKVNGRNVGIMELITPAIDTEIYNFMLFTDLDGKLLVATFNCTIEQMTAWEQISEQIIYSIQVL